MVLCNIYALNTEGPNLNKILEETNSQIIQPGDFNQFWDAVIDKNKW